MTPAIKSRGFEACTGCSLCLLACPVWRATHDIRFTPHGRAKALQHGASVDELADAMASCTLCGACEPACPEDIALVDMITGLRVAMSSKLPGNQSVIPAEAGIHLDLGHAAVESKWVPASAGTTKSGQARIASDASVVECLLPDAALAADAGLLAQAVALLGGLAVVADHGADIALALESGEAITPSRLEEFLAPLRGARRVVVADGLLLRALRGWLPGVRVEGFGEAASRTRTVRTGLRRDDFYVIEPRAYHADRERLVGHYDRLRQDSGCSMNLDMQRLAIPTTANSLPQRAGRNRVDPAEQARWILEGREFARIVVEDLNDLVAFRSVTDKLVVYVTQVGMS